MILITARVTVRKEHWDEAVALASRHVAASRREPGCASHDYFVDPEHERTLVFVESWKDQAAVDAHFGEPYSLEFAAAFKQWCEGDLGLDIHRVVETRRLTIEDQPARITVCRSAPAL